MADETLFELLHSEIVNYALENNEIKYKETKVFYMIIWIT